MLLRNIVNIDEKLCNGCGQCVSACAEGAIQLIDNKARLVKDTYCDGLGACLGECPQGAITIVQRNAEAFDEQAVEGHLAHIGRIPAVAQLVNSAPHAAGCPGSMMRHFTDLPVPNATPGNDNMPSALQQWPVQLRLLSPTAPYFRGADLLLAADCAAFAYGDFHRNMLQQHALAIACPKLDDTDGYVEKLAAMITDGGLRSITIVMMQVPCCRGLARMVEMAVTLANSDIPIYHVTIGIEGDMLQDDRVPLAEQSGSQ